MKKIIHYCWFGGKPLSKMAKKCIKSWEKYLPDYEIKEWNESNFDVNICPFVKEAYENKKWAFVSDYARIYALYKYGGIYFDTDMKVTKSVNFIEDKNVFLGYEDSGYFGTAVIGAKNKNSKYMKQILDYYDKQQHFYVNNMVANPIIITNLFKEYKCETTSDGIEIYDDNIYIYPREYFYPLSYNYSEKVYTNNTCMVHFFNGTWSDKYEKRTVAIYRKFGLKLGNIILKILSIASNIKNKFLYKKDSFLNYWKMKYSIYINRSKRLKRIRKDLENNNGEYLAIHHPEWIGVKNATQDSFKYTLELREQYTEKEAKAIAEMICKTDTKMVIFNAFAYGWQYLVKEIKKIKNDIKIKIIFHGGNALLTEQYDWEVFNIILDLYNNKLVDELGFVKKSLYDFYKEKGYKASFLMNNITIEDKEKYKTEKKNSNIVKLGMYASGNRWVKNTYNQVSAASLIENAELDCVPLSNKINILARKYNLNVNGVSTNVTREELYKRMAKNDINIYVTFTECAPLIPLESLELGVPCITGDNHHYFEGTELEKYLVVRKEDDIIAIRNQILYCLENKEKVMQLYKEWKKEYNEEAKRSVEEFLKI